MNVWIAVTGENCEGYAIIGIFSTFELAVQAAMKTEPCFDGGWIVDNDHPHLWHNGCDYLMVIEYTIDQKVETS